MLQIEYINVKPIHTRFMLYYCKFLTNYTNSKNKE